MTQFAIVFPGRVPRHWVCWQNWLQQIPLVETTFAEASAALGYDLWH